MTDDKPTYPKFNYDAHARTCAPDDFLGQTRRTVQGVPLPDEQINMIVEAVNFGLGLKSEDVLLELACGNGALSQFLFNACKEYLGVDISEYLISVAKNNFEKLPEYQFLIQGGLEYVRQEQHPERFSKALCYAGFQYFSVEEATEILSTLFIKFKHIQTFFIGNLPDKARMEKFYKTRLPSDDELSDPLTAIGTWRTRDEFEQLAKSSGWKVNFSNMPSDFHASYYRYDVLLSR